MVVAVGAETSVAGARPAAIVRLLHVVVVQRHGSVALECLDQSPPELPPPVAPVRAVVGPFTLNTS